MSSLRIYSYKKRTELVYSHHVLLVVHKFKDSTMKISVALYKLPDSKNTNVLFAL